MSLLSRQQPLSILPTLLCLMTILALAAQAQERESLKEPVFRVENDAQPTLTTNQAVATQDLSAPLSVAAAMDSATGSKSALATNPLAVKPLNEQPVSDLAVSNQALAEKALGSTVPAQRTSELADQDELIGKVASNSPLAKVAPPKLAVPHKPSPQDVLDSAVSDAKQYLFHINDHVRGYSCDFIKRETVDGRLNPTEQIKLKVRNEHRIGNKVVPFSVYMKFVGPKECRNREILYIAGQNNNKLLAKEGGTRGKWLPSVWLPIEGAFAMSSSSYPISQVGVKRLTERLIESAADNKTVHLCKVKYVKGAKVDGRECTYLEVIRPDRLPGKLSATNIYLAQVFMDQELQIPLRYAAYDWPTRPGGPPRLVEEYTYRNVKINPGLTDEDFNKNNPDYNF